MSTSTDTHPISPRRVRFSWDDTPLHWVPGEPFTTHAINVLHLLLPAGERWFVKVLRQALPLVDDDALRDEVKGFLGQEAVHARSHQAVLDHLDHQGLDARPYTDRIDWLFEEVLADKPKAPAFVQRQWLIERLALIAAIEHFTAVLGIWIVENEALEANGADPTMVDLLRWHGAEEVEHRSVAFDLFQHVSGNRVRRTFAMFGACVALSTLWPLGIRFLHRADPILRADARRRGGRVRVPWRRWRTAARRGLLPTLGHLWAAVPRYLRPGFHPSQEGDLSAAVRYLEERSPAVRASRVA